jgi:hypothetical protein
MAGGKARGFKLTRDMQKKDEQSETGREGYGGFGRIFIDRR